MTYNFTKLNDEPIEIEYISDERGEILPTFWWKDKRYYLTDFIGVHYKPWYVCGEDMPDYIHAVSIDYIHPIFISIMGEDYIDIYQEKDL